jgi:tetratricopeptide (TPR) repeat protein
MEKRIGVDGITRQLRGNAYFQSNDLVSALRYAEESIRLEPDRLEAHDQRATFLVHSARFEDAVAAYRDMERRFDLQFTRDIFTNEPAFAKFVESKAFGAWLPVRPKAD